MSIKASEWAWKLRIPASPKQVLLALAAHANDDALAWPRLDTLVLKSARAKSTVIDAIAALIGAGLLSRAGRRGRVVMYRLHVGSQPQANVRLRRHLRRSTVAEGDSADSPQANSVAAPLLVPESSVEKTRARVKKSHPDQLALKWPEVMKHVEVRVDPHRFFTWFRPIAPESIRGDTAALSVPNPIFADWLEDHRDVLLDSMRAAGVDVRRVKFNAAAGSA